MNPADRVEVRDDDDACCMISRMSSLFDVNVGSCHGSLDFGGVSKGPGSMLDLAAGDGLPHRLWSGTDVPPYSTGVHCVPESVMTGVGGVSGEVLTTALPLFDGVDWSGCAFSSSSISNIRSDMDACFFKGGLEGLDFSTAPWLDDRLLFLTAAAISAAPWKLPALNDD